MVKGDCDLPADVHIAIYRIAQEALNNVVKHAQAQKVEVSLECRSDPGLCAQLRIHDDGCGFDPTDVSADHMGLGIMRERAKSIGATLQVESEAGQGCLVSLRWTEGDGGGYDEC